MHDRQPSDVSAETASHHHDFLIDRLTVSAGNQVLLRDASATIPGGRITVLVGGSGAGKSVLLKILAGLVPPSDETIRWTGRIGVGPPEKPASHKRTERVGVVFQQFALLDELSPIENVQFAIDHRDGAASTKISQRVSSDETGAAESSKPATGTRDPGTHPTAAEWLDFLGVPSANPVSGLSGGQKQRLAIARTLAGDPEILLYDEPTSGLDAVNGLKVAELIRETQTRFGRTSLVVTHDYATLLGIADEVLLLDAHEQTIRQIPRDQWPRIAESMRQAAADRPRDVNRPRDANRPTSDSVPSDSGTSLARSIRRSVVDSILAFLNQTGAVLVATFRLPIDAAPVVPSQKWAWRFFLHHYRLIGGVSACVYLLIAGVIVGFTTTYFTLRFLPFRLYTQPLLIDELLASIGFALYRILVPILATVLIAARCGASAAADVGVKQYGGQIDAMKTFGVRPPAYLLVPMVAAFLVATPILEWLAFTAAHLTSRWTFAITYPEIGSRFWFQHFFRGIALTSSESPRLSSIANLPVVGLFLFGQGWGWVLLKSLLCGGGTAAIAYHHGVSPKRSAADVSHCITSTVLWSTLYVLIVHFVIAFNEF